MYVTSPVLPDKKENKSLDLQFTVSENSIDNAKLIFKTACERILEPGLWQKLSGTLMTSFGMVNSRGRILYRKMKENDFIRVSTITPALQTPNSEEWVKVEKIAANIDLAADESIAITLRASKDPALANDNTAKFFEGNATSTFIISLKNKTVTAFYFGRNEMPDINVPGILNKVRNGVMIAGAITGLSHLHWAGFLKSLLQKT